MLNCLTINKLFFISLNALERKIVFGLKVNLFKQFLILLAGNIFIFVYINYLIQLTTNTTNS